ncbi:hypothetical protein OSTOST_24674 [Ostertagia ostertagi]
MSGMYQKKGEKSAKEVEDLRKFSNFAIPFVMNSFGYPYQVVSTVMAVGLLYPSFHNGASFVTGIRPWDYLTPHGLKRGSRMFLREQAGAVSVGPDQQLYASTSILLARRLLDQASLVADPHVEVHIEENRIEST